MSSEYLHKDFNKILNEMLENVKLESIIMGDINVNFLKANDHPDIKATLSLHNYKQLLKNPTRTQSNTATLIDVVLTNNPSTISTTDFRTC